MPIPATVESCGSVFPLEETLLMAGIALCIILIHSLSLFVVLEGCKIAWRGKKFTEEELKGFDLNQHSPMDC